MQRIIMLLAILSLVAIISDYPSYTLASSQAGGSSISNNNTSVGAYNNTASSNPKVSIIQDANNTYIYNHTNGTAPYDPLVKEGASFVRFIVAESNGTISKPLIATSGRNLYLIYTDDGAGKSDVFVAASRDFGETFDPPINLTMNLTGNSTNPEIGAAGDISFMIFENNGTGNGDIFFGVSSTAGENWRIYDISNISNSTDRSYDSTLSVNEQGEYFVSWVDELNNSSMLLGYCGRPCW